MPEKGILFSEEKETAKALNDLARHELYLRILQDIRVDIEICKLEGWDFKEHLRNLKSMIDGFLKEDKMSIKDLI